ncbi:MAG: NAD(P)-binding domain-containing protein [Candidatus Thermoplasmatota archaeon]|nr:NAD(P)-binding domain-containing protein [Candidatus Thermoplasmatota archaeon]
MKFASIGHLMTRDQEKKIPQSWLKDEYILSPEFDFEHTSGYLLGLRITAKEMMYRPRTEMQQIILDAAVFLQDSFKIELLQLGALTTSVTEGGRWLTMQPAFRGFVNHGDSYTAAVACNVVNKIVDKYGIKPEESSLAVVGGYGIIGEAISKKLVPLFGHSIIVGRNQKKLESLAAKIPNSSLNLTTELDIRTADVVITATNHPSALIYSDHLKKGAVVVDVAQPPNVSLELCHERPDIVRVDGGYVTIPSKFGVSIPGYPKGKLFSCIAEVIMQALERDRSHHVGSIDMQYMDCTKKWAHTYGFELRELTNFGLTI